MQPIYFCDNPELGLAVVETAKGFKEYRINCKKIKQGYYVINKDCFLVDNKWYRIDSGLIEFDYEDSNWKLKGSGIIKGIVNFEKEVPVYGYFTPNPYNNCQYVLPGGEIAVVLNADILIQSGKSEDVSTGLWYEKFVKGHQVPRNAVDHKQKGYSIEDNAAEYVKKTALYKNYKQPISKNLNVYGHMLGDTTFGIEMECAKGNLPEHIQNRLGLVICRDGSLVDENGTPGPEFVSIPLSGARGLNTISEIGRELPKRTTLDLNCSLHIHFGTLPLTRTYLVTLYRLCYKLQNELFTMFPYYKAQPNGVKNKNYNQKLPTLSLYTLPATSTKEEYTEFINEAYKRMFSWLSDGYHPDQSRNRKNKAHPVTAKWDRKARYYWINFMNAIFSERNTIEFRLHTPTTNSQKIHAWLFICNAILKYAMNNERNILLSDKEISLNEVLDYYRSFGKQGEFLSNYLKAYVDDRKTKFTRDYVKGDMVSAWEYKDDSSFDFSFGGSRLI